MEKRFEISDMPPLSDEMHDDLRLLERQLNAAIGGCFRGYDLQDTHAAFEYVRTYAVKFYDTFYRFYSLYLDYEAHWQGASERFAYGRIVKCIGSYSDLQRYFERDSTLVPRIKRTISDHARRNNESLRTSLKVVIPPPQTAQPGGVFSSILDLSKSPPMRVPRSIQSNSAVHKMEAYREKLGLNQTQFANKLGLDPKTLYKFRRTGKVDKRIAATIAEEMGISVEQLLK